MSQLTHDHYAPETLGPKANPLVTLAAICLSGLALIAFTYVLLARIPPGGIFLTTSSSVAAWMGQLVIYVAILVFTLRSLLYGKYAQLGFIFAAGFIGNMLFINI